jgi:outer membrane immunogenic protein
MSSRCWCSAIRQPEQNVAWHPCNTLPKLTSECIYLPITSFCLASDCAVNPRVWGRKMQKILVPGTAGIAALMAIVAANAADLALRPGYTAPRVSVFTWSGCYIGGNIGEGWGRETVSIPNLAETTGVPELAGVSLPSATGNTKGVIGGGQVGCNYQFAPNWVIGIEGDGEAAGIKGDLTESVTFTDPRTGGPNTVTGTAHAQTDWIASVTGRLGWTWDRVMLYAKGGAAWAGDKYSADLAAFNEHIATSVTRPGWTVGGGIEWAFAGNWSAKVEYDYYDFSTRNLALPGTIFGVPEVVPGVNIKETISTVKFGINYRFGPY